MFDPPYNATTKKWDWGYLDPPYNATTKWDRGYPPYNATTKKGKIQKFPDSSGLKTMIMTNAEVGFRPPVQRYEKKAGTEGV